MEAAAKIFSSTQRRSHSHRLLLLRDHIHIPSPAAANDDDVDVHCRNLNLERTIITVMAATLSLFLVFLLIYKCVFHRPTPPPPPRNRSSPDDNPSTVVDGVNPNPSPSLSVDEELAAIPVVLYESLGDDKCAICLEEYVHGERVRVLPRCKHIFHKKCIEEWFQVPSLDCPICREQVLDHCLQSRRSNCRNGINNNASPIPMMAFNFGDIRYASYPSTLRIFA